MITAGLKLTKGGGVALLGDGKLEFNIEIQKLDNNPRHSGVPDLEIVPRLLAAQGYEIGDVDEWVVDGWAGTTPGRVLGVSVAPYLETAASPDPGAPGLRGSMSLGGTDVVYTSYPHLTSHIAAAYCTSPFAAEGAPATVLVWDGDSFPRLYHVGADGRIEPGGALFPLVGDFYALAAEFFGPARRDGGDGAPDPLSAGNLMAYLALGAAKDEILAVVREVVETHFTGGSEGARGYRRSVVGCGGSAEPSYRFARAALLDLRERADRMGAADADVLAGLHAFIEQLLVERLVTRVREWKGDGPVDLCFTGGCALNIKWNSALRADPAIREMWVPPFPDDSGSSIGAAAAHLGRETGLRPIEWSLRLGPALTRQPHPPEDWSLSPCRPEELARLLHLTGRPAVVLSGRGKLGPRALGSRSVLAPAVHGGTRRLLNELKQRDEHRPVTPICLASRAADIFDPGTPDPYMLYEHRIRPEWVDRIPAIQHLDGTARLQTVTADDDPVLATILREYATWSGIPVLCSTSAGPSGGGFFPDVASAMRWGRVDVIWSDGVLYQRRSK
ncbi:carbamoyltransferase N-terminal domain-containing protein [Herbidospora yilanensis]|uniref:carbamoyltransferase N-terminal domain-containing protein n=1 Tax=Herbidospora yilanensis TaxID=354426 RepID=UPI00078621BF|nr:carbamoyltransferase N-terminal domain-containing protein [Herbidospora yilanensis]